MKLQFDNGPTFSGNSFGFEGNVAGEIVFNTGMVGYVESLTDPSYRGQILVMTYPLQGNYGVPDKFYESEAIQVSGLVVTLHAENPNHFKLVYSLSEWLKQHKIPAMQGADCRQLAKYLREFGTKPGRLICDESNEACKVENIKSILEKVGQNPVSYYGNEEVKVLLIDTGGKMNIIRCLTSRGVSVIRAPWNSNWEKYLAEVDGLFLPNGPGDPNDVSELILKIKEILNDINMPVLGICFGNQLLALAAGAEIVKMKYGHRSLNQPVQDLSTGKCYITSQNHGYVIKENSLPAEWEPWFINLNDRTIEGIKHQKKPLSSVQFHPEACPGPTDTSFLFDRFIEKVKQDKKIAKKHGHIDKIEVRIQAIEQRS